MPGSVLNASPSGVMPQTLCTLFEESRSFAQLQSMYHDGTIQRGQLAFTSRRSWRLAKKLTSSALGTLRTFWETQSGGLVPFYFYDPFAGSPVGSNFDATGSNPLGRYVVVFRGNWSQETGMMRTLVPELQLMEVA